MPYTGVIIEESLKDTSILKELKIIKTEVEAVTERHQTPHVKQWTMHTVEIPEEKVADISERISRVLDGLHVEWYADFKNDTTHYIAFRNRVFVIDRNNQTAYDEARAYGISIGIPDYEVDFKALGN